MCTLTRPRCRVGIILIEFYLMCKLSLGILFRPVIVLLIGLPYVAAGQAFPFTVTVSGTGPDMVLIPGHSCDASVWDETVAYYEARYTCHALTLAGYAGTDPLEQQEALLPIYEAGIARYIQALPDHQALVVGHSIGGFLGLKLALDYPETLTGLIVVDALPFLPAAQNPAATPADMKMDIEAMLTMRAGLSRAQYDPYQRQTLAGMIRTTARIDSALEWSWRTDPRTGFQTMHELLTEDLRAEIARIKTPTLVLGAFGWDKGTVPGYSLESSQAIYQAQYAAHPALTLYFCEKARHFMMYDDFACMTTHLDAFLDTLHDKD